MELNNSSLASDANLISYWRMEGNSNDSKDSNNGTDTNITYSTGNGKFGQGAGFASGSSSKIVIGDPSNLHFTGNYTVNFWFKVANGYTSLGGLVQDMSLNPNYCGWRIYTNNGHIGWGQGQNTGAVVNTDYTENEGTKAVNDGNWHMVTCVYNGSTMTSYIDTIQDLNVSWAHNPAYAATNYSRMGCQNSSGTDGSFFTGDLDDVAAFNRTLSTTEIGNLYNGVALGDTYAYFM